MITPEAKVLNQEKDVEEFLTELAKLVIKYRTEIPLGYLLGALETVKFRLQFEAIEIGENIEASNKEKGQE